MFNLKNLSPQQLSALTALFLSVPIGLAFYALVTIWWIAALACSLTFIGSYFLIGFVLEWFIYRKIKLIYKFIYQTKATKKGRNLL